MVVPSGSVLQVVDDCVEKGVRSLVVISAGFAESGPAGVELQHQLIDRCRSGGIGLVGPNCMGIVNTDPQVRLNGTFAGAYPRDGRIGFLSQSGALGIAVMNLAESLRVGLSSFVSIGNKADISGNDLLSYWAEDERTDVLLLYLESFGNPRRFAELCRDITPRKPIVVVKSGRGPSGTRATASHTGALLAASDTTVDALLRQHGIIPDRRPRGDVRCRHGAGESARPRGSPGGHRRERRWPVGAGFADACEAGGWRFPTTGSWSPASDFR